MPVSPLFFHSSRGESGDGARKFSPSCPQIQAVEWPFGDSSTNGNGGNGRSNMNNLESIADYLSQKKIDLVINLPLRMHRATPVITKVYNSMQYQNLCLVFYGE